MTTPLCLTVVLHTIWTKQRQRGPGGEREDGEEASVRGYWPLEWPLNGGLVIDWLARHGGRDGACQPM